jgi:hypothetical protein
VSVNGTIVEAKTCTFALECTHFIFNKSPIYTHDGASAKFSTNTEETYYSVLSVFFPLSDEEMERNLSEWRRMIVLYEIDVMNVLYAL